MALKSRVVSVVMIILVLLISSSLVIANEITIGEAIEYGLAKSTDILEVKDSLEDVERRLKSIKVGADWHFDLNLESYINNQDDGEGEVDNLNDLDFHLTGSKEYWPGLTITPEIYGNQDGLFNDDDLDNELNFKFTLKQEIYPQLPATSEQDYIKAELDLEESQNQLADIKEDKTILWLEDYLNLVRLNKRYEVGKEEIKLAQNNLEELMKRREIGEASESELLASQIKLEESNYNLKKIVNEYTQAKDSLYNQLKLLSEYELVIGDDVDYIAEMEEKLSSLKMDFDDKDRLLNLAIDNSSEILSNRLSQKSLEYDMKWTEKSSKADLDLLGSYDSQDEEWRAGVTLSYNLFDSGEERLKEEGLEQDLELLFIKYDDIVNDLKLELDILIEEIELNELKLKKEELSLAKAKLDEQVARKQLKEGLIDELDYQEVRLVLDKVRIDFAKAEDQLLISRLELVNFLGIKEGQR